MRFPANCLIVAVIGALVSGGRVCAERNRCNRVHFYWRDADGRAFDFHRPGASSRSYLRNALYRGRIRARQS